MASVQLMGLNFMTISLLEFVIDIFVFIIGYIIVGKVYSSIKYSKHFDLKSYIPEDEVHSLRQIFYLILLAACFINVLYSIVYYNSNLIYFSVFDCILSLYFCLTLDKSTWKNKILLFLIIPFGSLSYLIFGATLIDLVNFIHLPIFIYLAKLSYDNFQEYTTSHGLGVTILLLFAIIVFSLIITSISEGVSLLDALVMASNAFTSNGYTVLGNTAIGKLDSLLLVWSGYVLSGVGTATLTAGILIRHFNHKFDELKEYIDEKDNK